MTTILVLGERRHAKELESARAEMFPETSLRHVLMRDRRAMCNGRPRAILKHVLGVDYAVANLLPPHPVRGAWNREQARRNAVALQPQIEANYQSLVIMGRKTADALGCWDWQILQCGLVGSLPTLLLPRPVSFWWNSADNCAAAREVGRKFIGV